MALVYAILLGGLAILPLVWGQHTVLIQDMLLAYYCYFDDFHRQFAINHWPLWSSSYQTGMPMYAYWQSGWLYPGTWVCFGLFPTQIGLYLFYGMHFALACYGFAILGPCLRLTRAASLWSGTVFALSGTLLARYEHPTFMAGWAYMPLVLGLLIRVQRRPSALRFSLYAIAFALQALGGHPQATITTALLILPFGIGYWPRLRKTVLANVMAFVLCLPLFEPFYALVQMTDRYGGSHWQAQTHADTYSLVGLPLKPASTAMESPDGDSASVTDSLPSDSLLAPESPLAPFPLVEAMAFEPPESVFGFQEFAAGSLRLPHLWALLYPQAVGLPAHGTWWGQEPWTEVYVGFGGLALLMLAFLSWKSASPELKRMALSGAIGLWLALGPLLGASQATFHLPILGDMRRPGRWDILLILALAAWSGQGFRRFFALLPHLPWVHQLWRRRLLLLVTLAHALGGLLFWALGYWPKLWQTLLPLVHSGSGKDYAPKLIALSRGFGQDLALMGLALCAIVWAIHSHKRHETHRHLGQIAFFLILIFSLVRLHWISFHPFPSDFYAKPPPVLQAIDLETKAFWRTTHYLEYPGDSLWRMHHQPLASMDMYEREKNALSYGIHAIYGIRHVGAHLPLLWDWRRNPRPTELSARYLFSDQKMDEFQGSVLKDLGVYGGIHAYEMENALPRLQRFPGHARDPATLSQQKCPKGYSRSGNLCVDEPYDGQLTVRGLPPEGKRTLFQAGDILLFREHAWNGWEARVDGGPWKPLQRDLLGFQFVPFDGEAERVEIRFYPRIFFWLISWSLVCFALLAVTCHFYMRTRISPWFSRK
jgi:hypothetical protein